MIYYIATIENGQVKNLKLATGDNPAEGEQSDGTTVVHIDFEINDRINFIKTNYWDGEWKTRTSPPNDYCSWDGSDWVTEATACRSMPQGPWEVPGGS